MNLKKMYLKAIPLLFIAIFVNCSNSDDDDDEYGNWVESSVFDGHARANAVTFTIGDKGYLVGGYDGDDYLFDTWEYNSEGDYWIKKADFPGVPRSGAVGFSLNGKGYMGTGFDGDNELKDFWQYNPELDQWTQKADFEGSARYGAVGFSVAGKGYIGTGYDGSEIKDFWSYNDFTNSWEISIGFGGQKRKNATVFVIGDIAYLASGINNGAYENDFYSFDGTTETWTRLKDLDDEDEDYSILLSSGVSFVLNGKGYIVTGEAGGITKENWEYDPITDLWEEQPSYEGSPRQDASAFSFSNRAFVLMGRSGGYYFDDIWEYRPDEIVEDND